MRLLVVLLGLLLAAPARAGVAGRRVVSSLNVQLGTLSRLPLTLDLAGVLWNTGSGELDPYQRLAARTLLHVIEHPGSARRLADAVQALPGGLPAALELEMTARGLKGSPETLLLLQDLLRPLSRELSEKGGLSDPSPELQPLLDALFDGAESPSEPRTVKADEFPRSLLATGAGYRDFGLRPGNGGVARSQRLIGQRREKVARLLARAERVRSAMPRVLTASELARLDAGRARPSKTAKTKRRAMRNFKKAARLVNAWVREGRDLELAMLVELNRALRDGVFSYEGAAPPGTIRTQEPQRAGHLMANDEWWRYASPEHVVEHLADFFVWYHAKKGSLHPVELAAKAYQQLVRIHPFSDANGRTTRLVMDFLLQRAGYPPASFDGFCDAVHVHAADLVMDVARGIRRSARALAK